MALLSSPSISSAASPTGPQLSITTSAASKRCFPDGCWLSTAREYVTFVIATTLTPSRRAASATSTGATDFPDTLLTIRNVPRGQPATREREGDHLLLALAARLALPLRDRLRLLRGGLGLHGQVDPQRPDHEETARAMEGLPLAVAGIVDMQAAPGCR